MLRVRFLAGEVQHLGLLVVVRLHFPPVLKKR
jgi:hypothetical protein